ncbi:YTH domain family protein [Echinococcus granulosus]|uniref:YTH domain family protein n=1 Tax=Echinococcus granulosus TaxID=6210 RepID=W6UPA9_ECHGR|nr:YTH domain family protein [Echinococcus granulosus]EUB55264.1 YTH domain family protein [Echinococcus granulosus]
MLTATSSTTGGEIATPAPTQTPPGRVLLFFSVNTSGCFCGVAEMTSPVDKMKQLDIWQDNRWRGAFKVRWIYAKVRRSSLFMAARLLSHPHWTSSCFVEFRVLWKYELAELDEATFSRLRGGRYRPRDVLGCPISEPSLLRILLTYFQPCPRSEFQVSLTALNVPNRLLRHIQVETTENRAVTHLRDTNEILPASKGEEMLQIIHNNYMCVCACLLACLSVQLFPPSPLPSPSPASPLLPSWSSSASSFMLIDLRSACDSDISSTCHPSTSSEPS